MQGYTLTAQEEGLSGQKGLEQKGAIGRLSCGRGFGDVMLDEDVEIELASTELSEDQRQAVSTTSDLDDRAPFTRVLDFLEEVFLALASGVGSRSQSWLRRGNFWGQWGTF